MSRRFYLIVVGATVLALFTPHPNIAHLGYFPIGWTLRYFMSSPFDVHWPSLLILIATYLVGWMVCALGLFFFCRLTGLPRKDKKT